MEKRVKPGHVQVRELKTGRTVWLLENIQSKKQRLQRVRNARRSLTNRKRVNPGLLLELDHIQQYLEHEIKVDQRFAHRMLHVEGAII